MKAGYQSSGFQLLLFLFSSSSVYAHFLGLPPLGVLQDPYPDGVKMVFLDLCSRFSRGAHLPGTSVSFRLSLAAEDIAPCHCCVLPLHFVHRKYASCFLRVSVLFFVFISYLLLEQTICAKVFINIGTDNMCQGSTHLHLPKINWHL